MSSDLFVGNANAALNISVSQKYVINHVYSKLHQNPVVKTMFLFGSCAKGNANNESDIDIFIVTSRNIHDDSDDVINFIYGVTDDIPLDKYISCDILTASEEDFKANATPLIRSIKSEGVALNGIL